MSTTTIRLPKALKERIARAAQRAGVTPHGFIVEAIAEKTEIEDRRAAFLRIAEARDAEIVRSGKSVPWREMRRYLARRAENGRPARPKARALARQA